MAVIVSMLRGINVGGHNMIKMEALRAVYESIPLREVQSYVQSGNVVFKTDQRNLAEVAKRIQNGMERISGCRPDVILRTLSELRAVIARNPFAKRRDIEPGKLLVTFLAGKPAAEARANLLKLKTDPEELRIDGRELYIYFPNGQGKSKLPWATLDRMLKTPATGRNWNTVTKLLEMAESMESSTKIAARRK